MATQNGKIGFAGIGEVQGVSNEDQALLNQLTEKLGNYLQRVDAQGLEVFGSKVVQRVRAASETMLKLWQQIQKQKEHEKQEDKNLQ